MAVPAVATVRGGFWNDQGVGSMVSVSGSNNVRRAFLQRGGARGGYGTVVRRVMWSALTGAAAGALVQGFKAQIQPSVELGGVRAVAVNTIFSRNSTAADVNEMRDWFRRMSAYTNDSNPPINLDRNPLGTR